MMIDEYVNQKSKISAIGYLGSLGEHEGKNYLRMFLIDSGMVRKNDDVHGVYTDDIVMKLAELGIPLDMHLKDLKIQIGKSLELLKEGARPNKVEFEVRK